MSATDTGVNAAGNPILEAANPSDTGATSVALDNNRPSQSSPLKDSVVTAADLEGGSDLSRQTSAATLGSNDANAVPQTQNSVESVLSSVAGAAATAPAAAMEAVSHKLPPMASSSTSTSTTSGQSVQEQAQKVFSAAQETASNLATQATTYAQQAVQKLPGSVKDLLPDSITESSTATPTHQASMPVASETRETTSAPIVDSRTDRPAGTHKALVPEPSTGSSSGSSAETDITKTHTTGNFEAAGSLQATQNPSILQAQSDLAAKAESGDL